MFDRFLLSLTWSGVILKWISFIFPHFVYFLIPFFFSLIFFFTCKFTISFYFLLLSLSPSISRFTGIFNPDWNRIFKVSCWCRFVTNSFEIRSIDVMFDIYYWFWLRVFRWIESNVKTEIYLFFMLLWRKNWTWGNSRGFALKIWIFLFFLSAFLICLLCPIYVPFLLKLDVVLFLMHSSWNRVTNTMTTNRNQTNGEWNTFEIGQWSHQSSKCRHLPCYIFTIEYHDQKKKKRKIRHLTSEHVNSSPSSLVSKIGKTIIHIYLFMRPFSHYYYYYRHQHFSFFFSVFLTVHSKRQNGISSSFHTLWIRISLKMLNNHRFLQFHGKK